MKTSDSSAEQGVITDADLTPPNYAPIYAVISTYADHPHASVEGSFADRDEAEELMKKCRATTEAPHPTAWSLWRFQIGKEPECLSP